MFAMQIEHIVDLTRCADPLSAVQVPQPTAAGKEIVLQVSACGVCHTELDEIEGRTPPPSLPIIPGHQVVGRVSQAGPLARRFAPGERVGVAWIHSACGHCVQCLSGRENLCPQFRATGRDVHGGYAQYMKVDEDFAYPIPPALSDIQAAPLLCAGAIGYRSLRLTGLHNGQRLGLTGFGASAHLVLKLVRYLYPDTPVHVFARSPVEQAFARELGAVWAGPTEAQPPKLLDAIIDTTPVWRPVIAALAMLAPGGRLVINAIRKESADLDAWLRLDYAEHLWQEKEIKSVANVARQDVCKFLDLAARIPLEPQVQTFPLQEANAALRELKQGRIRGAKVLVVDDGPLKG